MSFLLGVGIDVVDLERMARACERHGERFVARFCRPGEARSRTGAGRIQHLGGLFAAKEAVLKALGTGWGQGLGFRQIEVVRSAAGRPGIRLHDRAALRAEVLGVARIHLSITHERNWAAAVAILEGEGGAAGA